MNSPAPSLTTTIAAPTPADPAVQIPDAPPPPPAATAVAFAGFDTATQGAWKGRYGSLGVHMYPDGGTSDFPRSFIRGAGTQFRWPFLSFDPQLPQRYSGRNCCDPVRWTGGVVQTGDPWPPDARFGAGLYNRTADGVPFRIGITLDQPRRVSIYMVDYDRWGRSQRIDVYEQSPIQVTEPGSLGQPYANGRLLDSRLVERFSNGIYARWDVTGPVVFQISPVEPSRQADGSPVTDTNGLAVESGIFLDPIGAR